jgi:hypothetical protein
VGTLSALKLQIWPHLTESAMFPGELSVR